MSGRIARWLFVGMFCASVATCGQKGPLELPEPEAVTDVVPSRQHDSSGRFAGDHKGRPYGVRQPVMLGEGHGIRA